MTGAPQIDRHIAELLARCRTASLATVDQHGRPHAANIQYVHDCRWQLYFISDPSSRHGRDIQRSGNIAMTIYDHNDTAPEQIRGLQLHGRCHGLPAGKEHSTALDLYMRRFTFIAASPELRRAVESQQLYRVTVTWLRWIDNSRGFGFKHEWQA